MSVRIGVIGLGNMGSAHCRLIQSIPTLQLTAVSDIMTERVEKTSQRYACAGYANPGDLLEARDCDAVLIATPHYDHTTIGIAALKQGFHVLVEKPISVHKADCEKLIGAHVNPEQIFAAMFNQRTNHHYQKIRQCLRDGTFGAVRRFNWTITDWFRPQSYYNSGGWRATWAGEGGGVLMNQSPHQLDLLQWLFGMPNRVHAFCDFGRYHDIEVEDAVTARLEYDTGVDGLFVTTTGEAPGINRLEIAAENGLVVYDAEAGVIRFKQNEKTITEALAENGPFENPGSEWSTIPVTKGRREHAVVLENFADAILTGAPLIAPAHEGIHSVELANAMLLSGVNRETVSLPISSQRYAEQLKEWQSNSKLRTIRESGDVEDISNSF